MVKPAGGAPAAVAQVIAAGNAIASFPYIYRGWTRLVPGQQLRLLGLGQLRTGRRRAGQLADGLRAIFEHWGVPGPGRWITIYPNAGHVWMNVAGWRFDTVALATSGIGWAQGGGEFSGFVVRHAPGL